MLILEIAGGIILAVILLAIWPWLLLIALAALGLWWVSTWTGDDVVVVASIAAVVALVLTVSEVNQKGDGVNITLRRWRNAPAALRAFWRAFRTRS